MAPPIIATAVTGTTTTARAGPVTEWGKGRWARPEGNRRLQPSCVKAVWMVQVKGEGVMREYRGVGEGPNEAAKRSRARTGMVEPGSEASEGKLVGEGL